MKIGIYHIVGDELPPRDMPHTRERVTRYILDQEPLGKDVTHHWILNRIRSSATRYAIRHMIRQAPGQNHIVTFSPTFDAHSHLDDRRFLAAAININAVRNWAVNDGQARQYDWTIPLDGDCTFNLSNFQLFQQQCATATTEYLGIPMRRCLVSAAGSRNAVTGLVEPQIAFAKTAKMRFDPMLPFGQADKLELLIRLGFNPTSGHHTELIRKNTCGVASVVDHICMDGVWRPNEETGRERNNARLEGIKRLRQHPPKVSPTFTPLEDLVNVPNGAAVVIAGECGQQVLYSIADRLWSYADTQKTHRIYWVANWSNADFEQALVRCTRYAGRVIPVRMLPAEAVHKFDAIPPAAVFVATRSHELQHTDWAWFNVLRPGGMLFGTGYDVHELENRESLVNILDATFNVESMPATPEHWWRIVKPSNGEPPLW